MRGDWGAVQCSTVLLHCSVQFAMLALSGPAAACYSTVQYQLSLSEQAGTGREGGTEQSPTDPARAQVPVGAARQFQASHQQPRLSY